MAPRINKVVKSQVAALYIIEQSYGPTQSSPIGIGSYKDSGVCNAGCSDCIPPLSESRSPRYSARGIDVLPFARTSLHSTRSHHPPRMNRSAASMMPMTAMQRAIAMGTSPGTLKKSRDHSQMPAQFQITTIVAMHKNGP